MSERMFRLLKPEEIECRVNTINKNGLSLLLYKDARCDMNILDETIGPMRWTRRHDLINGNLFCTVGIRDGEWVYKQDVGTESYTEKEKGQASDSFKRACVNWGIGRELYTAPFIWIKPNMYTAVPKGDRLTTYDRFEVVDIGYKNNAISYLTIKNAKTDDIVFTYGSKKGKEEPPSKEAPPFDPNEKLTQNELIALKALGVKFGVPEDQICKKYSLKVIDEMTKGLYAQFMEDLKAWSEAKRERAARRKETARDAGNSAEGEMRNG